MTPITRLAQGIIMIAIPVLLTLIGVRLVMTPAFLTFEYTRPGFSPDFYGFTAEDRLMYGPYALTYLLNGDDLSFFEPLRLPPQKCHPPRTSDDCPLYNDLELRHLADVKQVVQLAFTTGLILAGAVLVAGGILWQQSPPRTHLRQAVIRGSTLTLALLITIAALALGAWDFFFDTFHALFFEDGTWQFYFSDTLIRLYPQQFWFEASIAAGLIAGIGAVLLLFLTWRWGHHQFKQTSDDA